MPMHRLSCCKLSLVLSRNTLIFNREVPSVLMAGLPGRHLCIMYATIDVLRFSDLKYSSS